MSSCPHLAVLLLASLAAGCTTTVLAPAMDGDELLSEDHGALLIFLESSGYPAALRLAKLDGGEIDMVETPVIDPAESVQILRLPSGHYRIVSARIDEQVYFFEAWRMPMVQFDVLPGELAYPGRLLLNVQPYTIDRSRSGPRPAGTSGLVAARDVTLRVDRPRDDIRSLLEPNYPPIVEPIVCDDC